MKITEQVRNEAYEMYEQGAKKSEIMHKFGISRTSVNSIIASFSAENNDSEQTSSTVVQTKAKVVNNSAQDSDNLDAKESQHDEQAKDTSKAKETMIKCKECGTENAIQNMLKYQDLAWYDQPLFFYNEKNPFCPECKEEIDLDKGDDKERQEEQDWF